MADNKGTYFIAESCPNIPSYTATGGRGFNMDTVKWMLTHMKPGQVAKVGGAYLTAANALATATEKLHQRAQRLVEVWSGKDAELALQRLWQLNHTAAGLHEASMKVARMYSWLGKEILPWYIAEGDRMGHGHIRDADDDKFALELLDRMDNRILQGYQNKPPSISKDLPPPPGGSGHLGTRDGGSATDTEAMGSPSGASFGSPIPGIPGAAGGQAGTGSSGWGGGTPDGTADATADLPHAGGTDLAGIGGGATADPFGSGGLGGGAGGLGGGAGGGVPGLGSPGPIGAGRQASGAGSAATRSTAGTSGLNGPMGAGGGRGGGEEEERERRTWLSEDEDIWTDDGDITTPPVIG